MTQRRSTPRQNRQEAGFADRWPPKGTVCEVCQSEGVETKASGWFGVWVCEQHNRSLRPGNKEEAKE